MTAALLCATAIAAAGTPVPQASSLQFEGQDAIIVTGERVPRLLRETPSSVAVVSKTEIEAQAAERIEDLLVHIPNVQLGSGSDGPTIRGLDTTGVLRDLGAFLGGNRPRATLQVDGRPVTYNEFAFGAAPMWDVERVEVFRSPQTTTQGRNSIAGAIFVETEAPAWEWEAAARTTGGNFDARQLSGVASGPLAGEQLAFRLSADRHHGRTVSRIGRNARGGPDPNDDDYTQVRLKLAARPTAVSPFSLGLVLVHTRSNAPQVAGVAQPFRRRRDPDATYGVFTTNVDSATARMSYAASAALNLEATLSRGDARIRRFAPAGFGETRIHSRDLSAETIARWRPNGSMDLIAGASALRTSFDQSIDLSATPFGLGTFDDVQKSAGLFGQVTLALGGRFKLTGGARYQWDRQDRDGALTGPRGTLPLRYHQSFAALLPKISAEYRVSPDLNVGALLQKASNPGGTTLDLFRRGLDTFAPEKLWDGELFARAAVPSAHLSLDANLFYYAMRNAQRPQQRQISAGGGPGPVRFLEIDNAPRARAYGGEAALRWRPESRLSLQASLGLLSTKVTRTLEPDDPLLGKSFQRSPRLTASAALDWRPVPRARLSAQLRHNTAYFSDDAETPLLRVGGSTTLAVRGSWQFRSVELFAFVRNAAGSFYLTYRGDEDFAVAGDPRKFGLGIQVGI